MKAIAHSLCSTWKYSPIQQPACLADVYAWSSLLCYRFQALLSGLSPHPGSLAYSWLLWWRSFCDCGERTHKHTGQECSQVEKKERESLVPLETTSSAVGLVAGRPSWLCASRKESAQHTGECVTRWVREREHLCYPGDITRSWSLGQTRYFFKRINFPNFQRFWMSPAPDQSLLSPC